MAAGLVLAAGFGMPAGAENTAAGAAVQQALESGRVSPGQVQEGVKALESGAVSPEQALQLQEKAAQGTLTPAEIEAGREMLEAQKSGAEKPSGKDAADSGEAPVAETQPDEVFFKKKDTAGDADLPIFGHNLFSSAPATFDPIKSIPVSNDYIVGPGDEIKILVWGRMDATYELEVDNEGRIGVPNIGPLTVAGLTFGEVKTLIKQKVEAITGVSANVSMGRLRTIQVFVLGEVKKPGVYTVSALATAANALLFSGGPTPLGSLRNVQVKRGGTAILTLDLYDFLLRGDTSGDMRLAAGDVVFVPQVGPMVAVAGNVQRPARYELRSVRTLDAALDLAGGLTPRAFNQRIQIERAFKNQYQIVLDIAFSELGHQRKIVLEDGDIIRVFSILPEVVNAVYLYGNVLRPGKYAYEPGLKVKDVIPDIERLALDTHLDYALIKRYRQADMEAELIPFDPGAMLRGDKAHDVALKPLDEIYIFDKYMFQDRAYAVIQGEVRKPGRYFIDQMTVRDLILKAGDLTDDAFLPKAELIRTLQDQTQKTLYFSVAEAMEESPEHNLTLADKDRIVIHSLWEETWKESVSIEGEIKKPGSYVLTQDMHLKDLIFKAGRFTRNAYLRLGHLYRTDWRTKEVTIHTFNLEKALSEDPAHNLVLQDLDRVTVHSYWDFKEKYTVSISGMVRRPGEYPYAENMTIRDLILVGGNVRDGAYLEECELMRYHIVNGKKVESYIIPFDVNAALAGDPAHNHDLSPLDAVNIKQIPDWWDKKKTVSIGGEVYFPGTYQIREEERLSSIIERAGGYKDRAYLRGGVFTRESVRQVQQERLDEMIKRLELEVARVASTEAQQALDEEDIEAQKMAMPALQMLLTKMRESKASGRVVTNFLPVDALRGTTYDLVLEDGDRIQIPEKPHTVNVMGAVYNPSSLIYNTEKPELSHYLSLVGGPTENAQKDKMYVIRANGVVVSRQNPNLLGASWDQEQKRWGFHSRFESTELYPGDTVLVPEKIERFSFMKLTKDVTEIMFNIAMTAGVMIQQVF